MGGRLGRLLFAVAVVAMLGAGAASAQVGIEARYEILEDEGLVVHEPHGPAMPAIACDGGWYAVNTWISPTDDDRHLFDVRVDPILEFVDVRHQWGGTVYDADFVCVDSQLQAPPPVAGWQNESAASSEASGGSLLPGPLAEGACAGEPTMALDGLAPLDPGASLTTFAPADASPICTQARAAAEVPEPADVPFTGRVTATLTDGDGQQLWSKTCTVVFGTCWDEGQAEAELPTPRPSGDADWTLSCETEPILDPHHLHAVGSFSCQAWLG